MGDDLQAIIEEFDLEERDRKLLRAVDALLAAREGRKKGTSWDRTYWGDENWLEARARVLRLIRENLIVAWGDLDQDPYFHRPKEEGGAGWHQSNQWLRAIDQHFLPNRPDGPDGLKLRAFQTAKKRTRYLTLEKWLHCALRKALQVEGREGPGLLRKLRERFHATEPCELDRLRYGDAESVEDNLQSPVIVSDSGGEVPPDDDLSPEEQAIVEAARRGGPSNEQGTR